MLSASEAFQMHGKHVNRNATEEHTCVIGFTEPISVQLVSKLPAPCNIAGTDETHGSSTLRFAPRMCTMILNICGRCEAGGMFR
jgi:hypothetical protein